MSTTSFLDEADSFVKEYLIWRGFHGALQSFNQDCKDDGLMGLSSHRLVQRLMTDADALKLDSIFSWWDEGVGPLLVRADDDVASLGRSLRDSTYRYYLVACFKLQRTDLVLSFFRDHWASRIGSSRYREEWRKQWFALPYTSAPDRDRYFSIFFSQDWRNALHSSLETFLNSLFSALPPPRLIALGSASDTVDALQSEISVLRKMERQNSAQITQEHGNTSDNNPVENQSSNTVGSVQSDLPALYDKFEHIVLGRRNALPTKIKFSPTCATVAVCGRDATAVVFPTAANSATSKTPRLLCDSSPSCLDWYDDSLLAIGTNDHAIHLWSPNVGAAKLATLRSGVSLPAILDVAFDPSAPAGTVLAACAAPTVSSLTGELQLWNTQAERLDRVLPVEPSQTRFNAIRFNHNGSLLVAGSSDGMMRVFDASRSGAIMGWPAFEGNGIASICLSQSETSVFALSSDGQTVAEWSLHRVGDLLRKWRIASKTTPRTGMRFHQLDVATSGKHLAVAVGGTGHVFSFLDDSVPIAQFEGVLTVDWDDERLVCGQQDGIIKLYTIR